MATLGHALRSITDTLIGVLDGLSPLLSLTLVTVVAFGWEPEGPLLAWAAAPLVQLVLMQRRFRAGHWKRRHRT